MLFTTRNPATRANTAVLTSWYHVYNMPRHGRRHGGQRPRTTDSKLRPSTVPRLPKQCIPDPSRYQKSDGEQQPPRSGAVFFCLSAFCISPHVLKALSFNFLPYTSREKITPAFQPYKFTSESCRKFFLINYRGKTVRFHIRHSGTFCAPSASGGIHPRPGRQKPPTGLWRPYRQPRLAITLHAVAVLPSISDFSSLVDRTMRCLHFRM